MLTERKRYNYNINSTTSATSSRSIKKLSVQTCINTPILHVSKDQNPTKPTKTVEELELANKRLLEETTRNFKRLESDVQRVERILEEKEANVTDLQQQTKILTESLQQAKEENQLLIEALLSKDHIIKEFQAKISELLEQRNKAKEKKAEVTWNNGETQTDPQAETFPADEMYELLQKNNDLTLQLNDCKEQLQQANNKVAFLKQQFSTFKQQAQEGTYQLQVQEGLLKQF